MSLYLVPATPCTKTVPLIHLLLSITLDLQVSLLLQLQQTALHLSSKNGNTDIVSVLLSRGADIHVKDSVSK